MSSDGMSRTDAGGTGTAGTDTGCTGARGTGTGRIDTGCTGPGRDRMSEPRGHERRDAGGDGMSRMSRAGMSGDGIGRVTRPGGALR